MATKQAPSAHLVLEWIRGFISSNGYSPTYGEISDQFDLGHRWTAKRVVAALADAGYLTVKPNTSRSIVLKRKRPAKSAKRRINGKA